MVNPQLTSQFNSSGRLLIMKTIKKFITALFIAVSLISINVYSTSAIAADTSFARIAVAIDHCLELLKTAKEAVDHSADKETVLKLLNAVRQESKEITGDNFGADLDFVNDDLKRTLRAVKKHESEIEIIERLDLTIKGFETLKKLAK